MEHVHMPYGSAGSGQRTSLHRSGGRAPEFSTEHSVFPSAVPLGETPHVLFASHAIPAPEGSRARRLKQRKRAALLSVLATVIVLELVANLVLGFFAWKEHRLNIELYREVSTIGVLGDKT